MVDGQHRLLQAGQPALERVQDVGHAVRQLVRRRQHLAHLGHARQLLCDRAQAGLRTAVVLTRQCKTLSKINEASAQIMSQGSSFNSVIF